ncbi:hypothetical protein ACFYW1_04435 [Streptomyces sp. NPDC002669]|uniref:hypothetical protein n=1 Tax=Streptomyces sp. NPDC002669 TaxID=3364658 RepID=UPI0036B022E6
MIAERSHGLPLYLDLSVMRFPEIRRTGRTPQPADFDHDFPALIARTLTDLTPDERHVPRPVSPLDSFALNLAARAAGMTHEAPAMRLAERLFVRENPFGLWPFYLHGLIRTADDRWSPRDWQQAAHRAFAAPGEQWNNGTGRDRVLLTGWLRQGLAVARDFRLDPGRLADPAWTYGSDSLLGTAHPRHPPTPWRRPPMPWWS